MTAKHFGTLIAVFVIFDGLFIGVLVGALVDPQIGMLVGALAVGIPFVALRWGVPLYLRSSGWHRIAAAHPYNDDDANDAGKPEAITLTIGSTCTLSNLIDARTSDHAFHLRIGLPWTALPAASVPWTAIESVEWERAGRTRLRVGVGQDDTVGLTLPSKLMDAMPSADDTQA